MFPFSDIFVILDFTFTFPMGILGLKFIIKQTYSIVLLHENVYRNYLHAMDDSYLILKSKLLMH